MFDSGCAFLTMALSSGSSRRLNGSAGVGENGFCHSRSLFDCESRPGVASLLFLA